MKDGLIHELVYGKKKPTRTNSKKIIPDLGRAMSYKPPKQKKNGLAGLMIKTSAPRQKRTKSNLSSLMVNTKKIATTKPRKASSIIGDRKTASQKRYLKKHTGVMRFADYDKDGVPNGLDCHWKDPTRHGVVDRIRNWRTGKGFKSDVQLAQKRFQESEKLTEIEKSRQEFAEYRSREAKEKEFEARQRKKEIEFQKKQMQRGVEKHEAEQSYLGRKSLLSQTYGAIKGDSREGFFLESKPKEMKGYKVRKHGMNHEAYEKTGGLSKAKKEIERRSKKEARDKLPPEHRRRWDTVYKEYEQEKKKYQKTLPKAPTLAQTIQMEKEIREKDKFVSEWTPEKAARARQKEQEAQRRTQMAENIGTFKEAEYYESKLRSPTKKYVKRVKTAISEKLQEKGFQRKKQVGWENISIAEFKVMKAQGKKVKAYKKNDKWIYEKPIEEARFSASRPVSKALGYMVESPDVRQQMKVEDVIIKKERAQKAKQRSLAEAAKLKRQVAIQSSQEDLRKIRFDRSLSGLRSQETKQRHLDALRKQAASRFSIEKAAYERKRLAAQSGREFGSGTGAPIVDVISNTSGFGGSLFGTVAPKTEQRYIQDQEMQTAIRQQEQRDAYKKQRFRDARNIAFRERVDEGSGVLNFMTGQAGPYNLKTVRDQGFSFFSDSALPQQEPQERYQQRYQIQEPTAGRYDPDAPKFVYMKKTDSFTRKTQRVKKGEKLRSGQASMPSTKARGKYPWTKPMKGWERVYVGKGQTVGRGRKKRVKKDVVTGAYRKYVAAKVKKQPFTKFVSTYGADAYQR